MKENVTPAQMSAIWRSLNSSDVRKRRGYEKAVLDIVKNGWASIPDIEDIFYMSDSRLDDIVREMTVEDWCRLFDLPIRAVYARPRTKQASVAGGQCLSSFDVAQLLIRLEDLGYAIDPAPIVDLLIAQVKLLPHVTDAQLSVLWFHRFRHKGDSLSIMIRQPWPRIKDSKTVKTGTGYKVQAYLADDNQPVSISVRGPKSRTRPKPLLTTCAVCGLEWYKGDPDSSAEHRRQHKKRLEYLAPQPIAKLAEEIRQSDEANFVVGASPAWKHRQMYLRALAFKREFGYDFVQWGGRKGDDDPKVHGYFFANDDGLISGACAVRWRVTESNEYWALQWIWLAPQFRRSGIVSKHWPMLRRRFGDFFVEPPVSPEMQGFLGKMGDERLMNRAGLFEPSI